MTGDVFLEACKEERQLVSTDAAVDDDAAADDDADDDAAADDDDTAADDEDAAMDLFDVDADDAATAIAAKRALIQRTVATLRELIGTADEAVFENIFFDKRGNARKVVQVEHVSGLLKSFLDVSHQWREIRRESIEREAESFKRESEAMAKVEALTKQLHSYALPMPDGHHMLAVKKSRKSIAERSGCEDEEAVLRLIEEDEQPKQKVAEEKQAKHDDKERERMERKRKQEQAAQAKAQQKEEAARKRAEVQEKRRKTREENRKRKEIEQQEDMGHSSSGRRIMMKETVAQAVEGLK